jgi:hypothetical protein
MTSVPHNDWTPPMYLYIANTTPFCLPSVRPAVQWLWERTEETACLLQYRDFFCRIGMEGTRKQLVATKMIYHDLVLSLSHQSATSWKTGAVENHATSPGKYILKWIELLRARTPISVSCCHAAHAYVSCNLGSHRLPRAGTTWILAKVYPASNDC